MTNDDDDGVRQLTTEEVARRIGLSARETRKLFRAEHPDHIPVLNLPRGSGAPRYRVREDVLDAWIARHYH